MLARWGLAWGMLYCDGNIPIPAYGKSLYNNVLEYFSTAIFRMATKYHLIKPQNPKLRADQNCYYLIDDLMMH